MTRLTARFSVIVVVLCVLMTLCVLMIAPFLPSAGQLVYLSTNLQGTTLNTLDVLYRVSVSIAHRAINAPFLPSPNGEHIAFYSGGGLALAYIVNIDGSGFRRLNTDSYFVGWMPNSTEVLSANLGEGSIRRVNIVDSEQEIIAQTRQRLCTIIPSPDGQFMAFQRMEDLSPPINAVFCGGMSITAFGNVDENTARLDYLEEVQGVVPVWSPDSRRLAILNNFVLYIVPDVTQGETIEVFEMSMRVPLSTLAWSLDSTRIALSADVGFDIFVLPVVPQVGTALNLTNSPTFQDVSPVWLANGREIAFISARDAYSGEIYVMNDDGSNVRRLTNNNDRESYLAWLP
jgi:hypothetical protein